MYSGLIQFSPLSFDTHPPLPTHVRWIVHDSEFLTPGTDKEYWLSQFSKKFLRVNISVGDEMNTNNLYNLKFEIMAQYSLFSKQIYTHRPRKGYDLWYTDLSREIRHGTFITNTVK